MTLALANDVLAWCNERRVEKDQEPLAELPKGARNDGTSCPCGKATGLFVGRGVYAESKDELRNHPTPPCVTDFVRQFDQGLFPDLIDHDLEAEIYKGRTPP